MNTLIRQNMHTVFIAVSSVLVMVAVVGAYLYEVYNLHAIQEDTIKQDTQTQIIQIRNAARQKVRLVLRSTQFQREGLNTIQVPENGIIEFLTKIEALHTATGARITVMSAQHNKIKAGGESTLTINIQAVGTFKEVYHTIALLEVFPRALIIQQVHLIQQPGKSATTSIWKGEFVVQVPIAPTTHL